MDLFFNHNQTLKFSWDNKRKEGKRALARLYRVYSYPCSKGPLDSHISEYKILGNCYLSDHLPLWFQLTFKEERPQGGKYKMNCAFLNDKRVVEQLKQ